MKHTLGKTNSLLLKPRPGRNSRFTHETWWCSIIFCWFTHSTWWFSIVFLYLYQSVTECKLFHCHVPGATTILICATKANFGAWWEERWTKRAHVRYSSYDQLPFGKRLYIYIHSYGCHGLSIVELPTLNMVIFQFSYVYQRVSSTNAQPGIPFRGIIPASLSNGKSNAQIRNVLEKDNLNIYIYISFVDQYWCVISIN